MRGTQPASVLAYLVLERPRPLRRGDLVELLWPGPLPDHWERASRRHDRCRGEELLRRAVELSECFRAPPFAARSRSELARLG